MMFSTNEKVPIYFDEIPHIWLGRRQIKKLSGKRQIKSKQIEIQK